jgi:hypothetical protein
MTSAATSLIYEALLAWAKVSKDDIVWVSPKGTEDKIRLVMDGRADLCFANPTSPEIWEADKEPPGIRWIALNAGEDPEGARRFQKIDPLINFAPIVNGVPSSLGVWGTGGVSLYTGRAATDRFLVYHLAKWLDNNWLKYRDLHSWNRYMTRQTLIDELNYTFLPCHEGLIIYLKELGLWTAAHERRQKENVILIERYCQAYRAAIDLADEKAIVVSPESNAWLTLWKHQRDSLGLPDFRIFRGL